MRIASHDSQVSVKKGSKKGTEQYQVYTYLCNVASSLFSTLTESCMTEPTYMFQCFPVCARNHRCYYYSDNKNNTLKVAIKTTATNIAAPNKAT